MIPKEKAAMTEFRHYSEFRQFNSDSMWHYSIRIRGLIPSNANATANSCIHTLARSCFTSNDSRELFAIYRWVNGTGDHRLIIDDTDCFVASPNHSRIAKRLGPIDRIRPMEPVPPPALESRIVAPGRRIPTAGTSVSMRIDHSPSGLTAQSAADTAPG